MEGNLDSILSEGETASEELTTSQEVESEVAEQATEQTADTTGEETAPPAEQQEADPIEKHRKGLEAAVLAERKRRQELEKQLASFQQAQQATQQAAQRTEQTAAEVPKLADFKTQEDYLTAFAKHQAAVAWAEREQADKEAKQRAAEEEHQANLARTANEVVKRGKLKFKDFDTVINDGLAPFLNPAMHQALLMGEQGHDVAYWLGNNPAEAERVSQMHPFHMAREIGLIEAKLSAAPATAKPTIPQTLTQARDARGQFTERTTYDGPTPLNDILAPPKR